MDPRATVRLGRTGLQVTRLGLGLAPIAGLYTPVPETQALATIDRAWEHGLRLFDTAPLYGYGRSEELAGRALRNRPRDEYVLCTKVGRLLTADGNAGQEIWADLPSGVTPHWDFGYDGVLRSVRDSRGRLGLDRIDVVHLHDPEDHFATARDDGYRALNWLRSTGQIGAVSVGTGRLDRLADFARHGRFDCFMIAGRYTLLDQSALDDVLPVCRSRGIAVLAAGVYNSGLLADPRSAHRFDYREAPPSLVERALAIEDVCATYRVPLPAAALQFPLGHPAVTTVVVGARTPAEVDAAVAGFAHDIPPALWAQLKHDGLLPERTPTPGSAHGHP